MHSYLRWPLDVEPGAIGGFGTTVWKFPRDLVPTSLATPSQPLRLDRLYTQNPVQVTRPSPSHLSTLVCRLLRRPPPPRSHPQEVAAKVVGGSISNIDSRPPVIHSPRLAFERPLPRELDVSGNPTELRRRRRKDRLLRWIEHHADIRRQRLTAIPPRPRAQVLLPDTGAHEDALLHRHKAYLPQEIVERSSARRPRQIEHRVRVRSSLCVVKSVDAFYYFYSICRSSLRYQPSWLAYSICSCLDGMTLSPSMTPRYLGTNDCTHHDRTFTTRSHSCNSCHIRTKYLHPRFSCYLLLLGSGYLFLSTLLSRPSFMSASFSKFLHCQLFSAAHSRFLSFKITCCICMTTQGPFPLSLPVAIVA